MRLLICTQTINKNDPILGFFHRWIEEFAKHFESIEVICLKVGEYSLPSNVRVHSLGKEGGESYVKYVTRFYRYLWALRGVYDRVFVHMNPHYVVLGGLWWSLMRTPIFFWRNHAKMDIMTRIAACFAKRVFYTSPFACTSRYAHALQMPVGIDMSLFAPTGVHTNEKTKVLLLGRLSPVKRPEIFIAAAEILGEAFEMYIYGDDPTVEEMYLRQLKRMAGTNVFFHPGIKNYETPEIYRAHDIYVNLTPEGSMDKTVLEAAACGVWVIVTNRSFSKVLSEKSILQESTPQALAERIKIATRLSLDEKKSHLKEAYNAVLQNHSLERLAEQLHRNITETV